MRQENILNKKTKSFSVFETGKLSGISSSRFLGCLKSISCHNIFTPYFYFIKKASLTLRLFDWFSTLVKVHLFTIRCTSILKACLESVDISAFQRRSRKVSKMSSLYLKACCSVSVMYRNHLLSVSYTTQFEEWLKTISHLKWTRVILKNGQGASLCRQNDDDFLCFQNNNKNNIFNG